MCPQLSRLPEALKELNQGDDAHRSALMCLPTAELGCGLRTRTLLPSEGSYRPLEITSSIQRILLRVLTTCNVKCDHEISTTSSQQMLRSTAEWAWLPMTGSVLPRRGLLPKPDIGGEVSLWSPENASNCLVPSGGGLSGAVATPFFRVD